MAVTKPQIEEAFRKYQRIVSGKEPTISPPRDCDWYVESENQKLFPARYIWKLASGPTDPNKYHTADAKRGLKKLGYRVYPLASSEEFEERVRKSLKDRREARLLRLANANKKPSKRAKTIVDFKRNPDVVAEVLYRANGICERCKCKAPFQKIPENTPYLEVHHKKWLSEDGFDDIDNAVALCPNCHRQEHSGERFYK